MTTFIFLTGAPRVGKDTYALHLKEHYLKNALSVQIIRLADHLKDIYKSTYKNYTLTEDDFKHLRPELFDLSVKIKEKEGVSYFARHLFKVLSPDVKIVIVPDLRFIEEYNFFKSVIDPKKMKVLRVCRKGFNEDSEWNFDINLIPYDDVVVL